MFLSGPFFFSYFHIVGRFVKTAAAAAAALEPCVVPSFPNGALPLGGTASEPSPQSLVGTPEIEIVFQFCRRSALANRPRPTKPRPSSLKIPVCKLEDFLR